MSSFSQAYSVRWGYGGRGCDQCTLFKLLTMAFIEFPVVVPLAATLARKLAVRKKRKLDRETSALGHLVVTVLDYHIIDDHQ